MTQFTCKGVKQINNPDIIKYDIHLYHSYFSVFFVSTGVLNGEFPEILIAKCRSRFYCTWFFSRAEDFESWREGWKGPSKSGETCSCRKVHMYVQASILNLSSNELEICMTVTNKNKYVYRRTKCIRVSIMNTFQ